MRPTVQEEDIAIYAETATTIQEPQGANYTRGATVGRTVPAKWWNWLFREITKRLHSTFLDNTNQYAEVNNAVVDAGITPTDEHNDQLVGSVRIDASRALSEYMSEGIFKFWFKGVPLSFGHKENLERTEGLFYASNRAFAVCAGVDSLYPYFRALYTASADGLWIHTGLYGYSFGAVSVGGLYYVLILSLRGNVGSMCLKVTSDFRHYTDVLYFEVANAFRAELPLPVLTEVEGTVYLLNAYDDNSYAINGTQATIVQGLVDTKVTLIEYWAYPACISREALKLADNKYLAANYLLSSGTWSKILSETNVKYTEYSTAKLRNGALLWRLSYNFYVVDATGTPHILENARGLTNSPRETEDCAIFVTVNTGTWFCYGDATLQQLPMPAMTCVKFGNTYYLNTVNDGVFSIEGSLSTDINDYTLLHPLDAPYSMYKLCETEDYKAVLMIRRVIGDNKFYLSTDFGQHLSMLTDRAGAAIPIDQYAIDDCLQSFSTIKCLVFAHSREIYSTKNKTNIVKGSTLYLK